MVGKKKPLAGIASGLFYMQLKARFNGKEVH